MNKHYRFIGLSLLLSVLSGTSALATTAPYPQSTVVPSLTWDLSSTNTLRKAPGSDIWTMTWASDGNLYGGWGDGGGFQGDNTNGRVSLGFARVLGVPVIGSSTSYSGQNVWGRAPNFAENLATFGGKPRDMISVDGVLYAQAGVFTAANCMCDPTMKSGSTGSVSTLVYSSDLAKSWQIAPWTGSLGISLQFGQDYKGAFDPLWVYYYYQRDVRVGTNSTNAYLSRVRKTDLLVDPATAGHTQYFENLDANGNPVWSTTESDAAVVFHDGNNPSGSFLGPGVVYDAAIGRYLLTGGHGPLTGQIGIFEGPRPWGPWSTVYYNDDWGGFNETAGEGNGMGFPAKWISTDGKTLWAVFSGLNTFDSFNVAKATLTTSSTIPAIASPAPSVAFTPSQVVTATGTGAGLSWSVQRLPDGLVVATGSGSSISFTVPADITSSQQIRIMLTASGVGSVYNDHAVQSTSALPGLVGYWNFDEGSGTSAADSSGQGNTATLVNSPGWVAGHIGPTALSFGTTSYVNAGHGSSLANVWTPNGMTVSAWINPTGSGGGGRGRIVDKDDGWFFNMNGTTGVSFTVDQFTTSPVIRISTNGITLNTWQHVAATWDGSANASNVHIYINGVLSDSTPTNGSGALPDDSTAALSIGNRAVDLTRGFAGSIDDLRVYNRILSAAEIQALATGKVNVKVNFVSSAQTYTTTTAQAGSLLYIDRTFTITALPSSLVGDTMIQTANGDKTVTTSPHLSFSIDQRANVYVIYSTTATSLPGWLNDGTWTTVSGTFTTTDSGSAPRSIYRKSFPAGIVSLGGNLASPAGPSGYSNYVVIVGP